jgi:tripartite-type tricarboxylate transporter receptor subunit TctC
MRGASLITRSIATRAGLAAMVMLASAPGRAGAEDFYAGKTVSIIVDGGGAYQAYARVVSQYLTKYVPGHPAFVVQEMPGAGGVRAANYLYRVAPRDGTMIAGLHGAVLTSALLNPGTATFDASQFSWIGNVTHDTFVGYVWHTSPVQSLAEARTRQLVLGGTSLGGNGIDMSILARDLFGLKVKIVSGYKTSAETKIALERGEIDGTFANLWSSLKQTDWLAKGLVRVIVQHGSRKNPEIGDAPLFRELARNETERQMIEVLDIREEIARPYLAPPGLPADRLEALRRAFDATMADPEFHADMAAQHMELDGPMSGRDLAMVADRVAKTPPAVIDRLLTLFNNYRAAR